MPTKYQAQVMMNPKVKPSHIRREAATLAQNAGKDAVAVRLKSAALQPVKTSRDSPSAAAHQEWRRSLTSVSRARVMFYGAAKRTFDFVVGLALLIVAAPIILTAAVAIRLETKGSPFFVQTRLGKNGKAFKIVKLRGMFIDARTRFASYYDYSRHRDLEFCFHHEEDPRVTRAGKFIRRTSIDELPNLWNVVLGDMSLVGPRPEIPEVLELYGPYREEYLSIKPGVTCFSKCTGRDRLTKKETIEFDLEYVRSREFTLDLAILWKTFRSVVLRRDVF
jgi:lipopolysaccharide/colanic/teichoic acid biosynthesis glycosyltransferase